MSVAPVMASKGVLVTLKSYQDSPSFQVKITCEDRKCHHWIEWESSKICPFQAVSFCTDDSDAKIIQNLSIFFGYLSNRNTSLRQFNPPVLGARLDIGGPRRLWKCHGEATLPKASMPGCSTNFDGYLNVFKVK
jgi:hypothetical protein